MRGPKAPGPYGVGYCYEDGTWEIFPEYYHNYWLCLFHYFYCWSKGWPHLIAVMDNPKHNEPGFPGRPKHIQWFRRHWILPKMSLIKWGLSIYWHHYPSKMEKDEPLGLHGHPRHVFRLLLKGGYLEGYLPMDEADKQTHPRLEVRHVRPLRPSMWIKPSMGHKIFNMKAGTRSLFVMVGKWHGWRIHRGDTPGSSRVLQQGVAGKD